MQPEEGSSLSPHHQVLTTARDCSKQSSASASAWTAWPGLPKALCSKERSCGVRSCSPRSCSCSDLWLVSFGKALPCWRLGREHRQHPPCRAVFCGHISVCKARTPGFGGTAESQGQRSWKRALKSLSPTYDPTLPCQPDHGRSRLPLDSSSHGETTASCRNSSGQADRAHTELTPHFLARSDWILSFYLPVAKSKL